jgi:hypothetical protein
MAALLVLVASGRIGETRPPASGCAPSRSSCRFRRVGHREGQTGGRSSAVRCVSPAANEAETVTWHRIAESGAVPRKLVCPREATSVASARRSFLGYQPPIWRMGGHAAAGSGQAKFEKTPATFSAPRVCAPARRNMLPTVLRASRIKSPSRAEFRPTVSVIRAVWIRCVCKWRSGEDKHRAAAVLMKCRLQRLCKKKSPARWTASGAFLEGSFVRCFPLHLVLQTPRFVFGSRHTSN